MFSKKLHADLSRSFGSLPPNCTHAEDYETPLSSHLLNSFHLVFTLDCIILKYSGTVLYPNCKFIIMRFTWPAYQLHSYHQEYMG